METNANNETGRALDHSIGAADGAYSLHTLLDHLQGGGEDRIVGAGLAQLGPDHLAAIYEGAETQVNECLRGLAAILQVLTFTTRHLGKEVPVHVVQDISAHLQGQTQALECWNTLADHAAYLLNEPLIARDLAGHYADKEDDVH
jgi:hypothetical protein